jgi:hypothetical protein
MEENTMGATGEWPTLAYQIHQYLRATTHIKETANLRFKACDFLSGFFATSWILWFRQRS